MKINSTKAFETKLNNAEVPLRLKEEIMDLYPDKFKKGKIDPGKSAFLYGANGTGKTVKAISLVLDNFKEVRDIRSGMFMFGNVSEILFQVKQTYRSDFISTHDGNMTAEEYIIQKYSTPDFLVLDDLGVEKTSEFTNQTLYLIINRRYENKKVTFVTSNLDPIELEEKMEDSRIISRLMSDCVLIKMTKQHRNK